MVNEMNQESTVKLLQDSLVKRRSILFSKLDNKLEEFKDTIIKGILFKIPKINQIPNKRYYQFKIRLPIGYETTTKYRIRFKNSIYDLYKGNNNYYLIDIPRKAQTSKTTYDEFKLTIQFSFVFYLIYTLLDELKSRGVTIELKDYLFTGLLEDFNTKGGQLKLTLTTFPVDNKEFESDHLYISLFN